jgi:hypothetical protein
MGDNPDPNFKPYNYPCIVDHYLEIYNTAREQPRERPAVS